MHHRPLVIFGPETLSFFCSFDKFVEFLGILSSCRFANRLITYLTRPNIRSPQGLRNFAKVTPISSFPLKGKHFE